MRHLVARYGEYRAASHRTWYFTVSVPPIRPIENILALVAALLVTGAVFSWPLRIACAIAAVGVLLLMIVLRYKSHVVTKQKRRVLDVYATVDRIRTEREARYRRGRPRRRDT
jgi:hypothetical protein